MKLDRDVKDGLPQMVDWLQAAQANGNFAGAQLYMAWMILCSDDGFDYFRKKGGVMDYKGDLVAFGSMKMPASILNPWCLVCLGKAGRLTYRQRSERSRKKAPAVARPRPQDYRRAVIYVLNMLARNGIKWSNVLELFNHIGPNGQCVLTSDEWTEMGDLFNQVWRRTDLPIADGMVRVYFEFGEPMPSGQELYVKTRIIPEIVKGLGGTHISDRRADIPKAEVCEFPGLELVYSYLSNRVLRPTGTVHQENGERAFAPGSETNACPDGPRKIFVKVLWDWCE